MKTITRQELAKRLARLDHSTFLSFTSLTTVKTPAGAPVIKKLSRVNLCVGRYANAVTRRRAKSGNEEPYVAKPRSWGAYVPGSIALVEHRSKQSGILKHYLSGQVLKAKEPVYLLEQVSKSPRKRPRLVSVDKALIQHWLPSSRVADTAAQQGVSVDNVTVHRDYDLAHLSCVSIDGETLRIEEAL